MRVLALAVVWVACASAARAQAPAFEGTFAVPYISCDCDPSEFVFRTLVPIAGHAEPRASSRRVRTVDAGRRIEGNDWNESLTVTVRAGLHRALRTTPLTALVHHGRVRFLDGADDGEEVGAVVVGRGQTVEILSGGGEGRAMVRVDGVVYLSDGGELWGDAFEEVRQITEQVWLRLTPKPGRPAAWILARWYSGSRREPATLEMLCDTHTTC